MHIRVYLYYEICGSKKILFTRYVDKKKKEMEFYTLRNI